MSEELKQQILSYMEGHNTMTLGTCHEEIPWAATVFYASDGLHLYFFSAPDSRHCQNLAANSRVAVTIQEDYQDWRKIKGIQLEGKVVLVDSLIEKGKAMTVYARKYPDIIKLFTDPTSGIFYKAFLKVKFYCVVPERVFYIDNEQGFGKRQELVVHE
ncbi:MAG: pyridoxamine 5'-phosphate oxidase family protein [Deltaproteobacteria bacterium]|nr:pyridoxamine 5'-phosphate oxidase family protein [Deltaproteobacteria bacterium]MCZ6625548.1 pyridoxamine 5'-phosphate oxidase family protein [Deltaproteobacteria bacterium]